MKSVVVEVINTGTELLLGRVVNTNASWLGRRLFEVGIRIERQTVVPDGMEILQAMREASSRADVVIVSGGLGPTSDDVTREALCELCHVSMSEDERVLARLRERFLKRNIPMSPSNLKQALVPQGALVLANDEGTAPGLLMPHDEESGCPTIILLPGPPSELKPMVERFVVPFFSLLVEGDVPSMLEYRIVGLGESALQDRVDAQLSKIFGLEWGYCARTGEVDVRLIGNHEALDVATNLLKESVGRFILTPQGASLEGAIVAHLRQKGKTVTTAESCTGGLIAKRITDVSGASEIFHYGWVTYANEAKESQLGVHASTLDSYGAVSTQVVAEMAEGALRLSGADYAVAVSGIAGPDGGTDEKPVGTVCFAWAIRGGETRVKMACYPGSRESFRQMVSQVALTGILQLTREGEIIF
ncbi:MAG: competence/damage-inducible protein A [Akkermansia sp.]